MILLDRNERKNTCFIIIKMVYKSVIDLCKFLRVYGRPKENEREKEGTPL